MGPYNNLHVVSVTTPHVTPTLTPPPLGTGPDSIVPQPILKQVHRQNLEYLHTRAHFNYAYFQFMKQILILNFNFAKQQVDSGSAQDPMVGVVMGVVLYCDVLFSRPFL